MLFQFSIKTRRGKGGEEFEEEISDAIKNSFWQSSVKVLIMEAMVLNYAIKPSPLIVVLFVKWNSHSLVLSHACCTMDIHEIAQYTQKRLGKQENTHRSFEVRVWVERGSCWNEGAMKGMWDVMGNCSTHHWTPASLKFSLYISIHIDGEHAMNISSRYMPAIWGIKAERELYWKYLQEEGNEKIGSFFFVAGWRRNEEEWKKLSGDEIILSPTKATTTHGYYYYSCWGWSYWKKYHPWIQPSTASHSKHHIDSSPLLAKKENDIIFTRLETRASLRESQYNSYKSMLFRKQK
jgi:hypothetical protein